MVVVSLLGFTVIGYLLVGSPIFESPEPLLWLPFLLPFSFWMFSKLLFDDDFRWNQMYFILSIAVVVIHYIMYFRDWYIGPTSWGSLVLEVLQHIISLAFIFLAILEAIKKREEDLVLNRIKFRNTFILGTASLMLFTVVIEIALRDKQAPFMLELVQKSTILLINVYIILRQTMLQPGWLPLQPNKEEVGQPNEIEVDQQMMDQLFYLLEQEKIYKTEGLTIGQLAKQLGQKEYKLRQVINQHLGFKNFSAFLNAYRIEEAKKILADTKNDQLTILEIAYSLGYQSLAPFNRAFKQITTLTPTAFRKSRKC